MSAAPIDAIGAIIAGGSDFAISRAFPVQQTQSFSDLLVHGINDASGKVQEADRLARAFVLDDNIPVHQVMFALEEARMSLELMVQVRDRLIEGYQQIMNMAL